MNTLIIGGSGQVGGYLRRQFEPTTNLISTYYSHKQNGLRKLDIGNKQACEDLLGYFRPSLILLPAAMTYVDGCEKEPERCFATNVNGIENIARLAKELQSRLVFFSTDFGIMFPVPASGRPQKMQRCESPFSSSSFCRDL